MSTFIRHPCTVVVGAYLASSLEFLMILRVWDFLLKKKTKIYEKLDSNRLYILQILSNIFKECSLCVCAFCFYLQIKIEHRNNGWMANKFVMFFGSAVLLLPMLAKNAAICFNEPLTTEYLNI